MPHSFHLNRSLTPVVEITPFTGLLYDQDKTGPLSKVVAPPYDVIKAPMQEELYQRSPYNVVRLILAKELPDDDENDNRYTRAARDFQAWSGREKVLLPDRRPCYYAYSQDYQANGERRSRMGFFARIKLEDFSTGNICPHEFTLAKAKKDRSQLLRNCRANFSPVFGLFSDPEKRIDEKLEQAARREPLGIIEEDGVTHKLWRIDDEATISFLSNQLAAKKVYIADGHHRYETALAYHKAQENPDSDSAHVMMFLTNLDSGALSIFPIHRLVRSTVPFEADVFLSRLQEFFEMEDLPAHSSAEAIRSVLTEAGKNRIVFVVYLGGGRNVLIKLKSTETVVPYLNPDEPAELQVLDVVQLHSLIIKPILQVDTRKPENQSCMSYTINIDLAIQEVDAGKFHTAFFMNPTKAAQVQALAEKGIRLPQKATYFYPKLLSGLVFNKFQS